MSIDPEPFTRPEIDKIFGLENVVFMQECAAKEREVERAMIFPKLPDLKRIALEAQARLFVSR